MQTKVISGFPGVGKTECTRLNPTWLDSDSSIFSWKRNAAGYLELDDTGNKTRDPTFPNNYINHIKNNIGRVPVIFVSSHKDVRKALVENCIPFTLVYPKPSLMVEYVTRYEKRGSPASFINYITQNWDPFIEELINQPGCKHFVLREGQYLSDVIDRLTA